MPPSCQGLRAHAVPLLSASASPRFSRMVASTKSLGYERVGASGSTGIELHLASQRIPGLAWEDRWRRTPVSTQDGKPPPENNQLQALEAPSPPPQVDARDRIAPERCSGLPLSRWYAPGPSDLSDYRRKSQRFDCKLFCRRLWGRRVVRRVRHLTMPRIRSPQHCFFLEIFRAVSSGDSKVRNGPENHSNPARQAREASAVCGLRW